MAPVRLAVTLGDPRGIGPEVAAAAARRVQAEGGTTFVFVGPSNTGSYEGEFISVGRWQRTDDLVSAGHYAARAIKRAVHLALRGEVDAIVTAPIDKYALNAAGYDFPGHTEMLAALAGNPRVAMMMVAERTSGNPLRVVLATTHIPLSAVPRAVTTPLLVEQALLAHEALTHYWNLLTVPRLALCAINPHASDSGLFGDEEERIMKPAIEELIACGVVITGPISADTVFVRALRGEFDAVIAPYHDVGMAPFKTAAFGHGVNVTLGLPFVRTSPDHGTAIDIAGTGTADSSSMEEAIRLAVQLVTRKAKC